ncbi:MAG: type II secretion system secretin GspD [Thermodesulfobacteriota bacterium]
MHRRLFTVCLGLLILVFLASNLEAARVSEAAGKGAAGQRSGKVAIDFRDADIRVVAKFISEITGKNFVFDSDVKEKVTVFSPTEVTADEAYRLFETVLKVNGYTTVPSDGVIKIVSSKKARTMDVETRRLLPDRAAARDDRVVTQLIRLKYADANELRAVLQPLIEQTGALLAYESGNTIIVTDYASNIDRLAAIIQTVDTPEDGRRLSVITLKHASAKDLATQLQQVQRTTSQAAGPQPVAAARGPSYQVVADDRTNSLIILARPAETEMIRELARRIDVPSPRGADRVQVVFLKHAVAAELAKVLNELTGKVSPTASASTERKTGAPTPLMLQEEVIITAEPATNALIIKAERQDFQVIKGIIEQLDIQRAQVLVEGVIMEMSMKKANALGAEWRLLDFPKEGSARTSAIGGTNLPASGSSQGLINQLATQPFAGPAGLVLGAAEGTITWGGATFLNIGLLVQALEQDSDVNILSTPHLLTMDNEEAKIVVGQERPFLKSTLTAATGATTPSVTNTYEFKDLGLTLKITPHITQGDYIKLKIFQQLKNFISEAETGAISSTKRETETTVQVRNRETVVIGGLIGDEARESKTQVPCIGDIPLLGWAFKQRGQSSDKLNLLILINPSIIRTAEQLRELTDKKIKDTEKAGTPEKAGRKDFPSKGLDLLKD